MTFTKIFATIQLITLYGNPFFSQNTSVKGEGVWRWTKLPISPNPKIHAPEQAEIKDFHRLTKVAIQANLM